MVGSLRRGIIYVTWKTGHEYYFCNNWHHYAGGLVPSPLAYVGDWKWPRDTSLRLTHALYTPSCDTAKASIDSITGLVRIGCNWSKLKAYLDSGVAATYQQCAVSIRSDSVVVWQAGSRPACLKDSVVVRKKYGARFRPDLPADTSLFFQLVAKESFK